MKKEIYFAGGCYWGLEKLFSMIPNIETEVGFANGDDGIEPTYEMVCNKKTGFKETVKVTYDSEETDIKKLLFMYFQVIDPTVRNRQGFDVGHQYQTGIYYTDKDIKKEIDEIILSEITYAKHFFVEIEPLKNYFKAEDEHQHYLDKHPGGYCHIHPTRMEKIIEYLEEHKDDFKYDKAAKQILRIEI